MNSHGQKVRFGQLLISVVLLCLFLTNSCDDAAVNDCTNSPSSSTYTFDNYVKFTSGRYLRVYPQAFGHMERYIQSDISLGEPFTDVNGNGAYDPESDIFIISTDSTNQDLNLNGKYDSPDDPWSDPIPFLDFEGNGVYDANIGGYERGVPFCDDNNNGKCDFVGAGFIAEKYEEILPGGDTLIEFNEMPEAYAFDAGIAGIIRLPEKDKYIWDFAENRALTLFGWSFTVGAQGLSNHLETDMYGTLDLDVLPRGEITDDVEIIELTSYGTHTREYKIRKEIRTDERLRPNHLADWHEHLVMVDFQIYLAKDDRDWYNVDAELKIYFSPEDGFLATEQREFRLGRTYLIMFDTEDLPPPPYPMSIESPPDSR